MTESLNGSIGTSKTNSMSGKERHLFGHGHTARGQHPLYNMAITNLASLYVLEGEPGMGKSTAMNRIATTLYKLGHEVEYFHSPLHPDTVVAIHIPDLRIAVVDGGECPELSTADRTERFDFTQSLNDVLLKASGEDMEKLKLEQQSALSRAYDTFAEALRVHDEWEKIYIKNMDFSKGDALALEVEKDIFGQTSYDKKANVRHMYLGAATPQGSTDFVQNLTEDLPRRIFIKGRPGTGKSTLLKHVTAEAEKKGIDVDVFHCGFDPNSLDMLIFRELGLAIFDSTAPHEYDPSREGDTILDTYERLVAPGIDEKFTAELADIHARYKAKIKEAVSYLREAQAIDFRIRAIYSSATQFSHIDQLVQQLEQKVLNL